MLQRLCLNAMELLSKNHGSHTTACAASAKASGSGPWV
jgi:hypothetical protein